MIYRVVCMALLFLLVPPAGPQTPSPKPSELVVGKLVYVEPMPAGLDQWILEHLRLWGKYKVTGDPEGVDLVVRAATPDQPVEYETRGGVPQPRREGGGIPLPGSRGRKPESSPLFITIVDWVTNETLWHADILDRKQKKNEPDSPAGPHTKIFARGLTPDQLAQKIITKLREYVNGLEKGGGGKQQAGSEDSGQKTEGSRQ